MDFQHVSQIETEYRTRELSKEIAPGDEMYWSGPDWYWVTGEDGLKCILRGLALSKKQAVTRILDIPCGHGRVGRHIRSAFPEAEIFGCDIDRTGVDFCAQHFGMLPIYSKPELEAVDLPADIDVIWVGSLFTHIDEDRTTRWLKKLARHLSHDGILVATFHGLFTREFNKWSSIIPAEQWALIESKWEAAGYGYEQYPGMPYGDYGISLSKPSKILDISTTIPDTRVLAYSERGWSDNHDVLTIGRTDRLRGWW